MWKFCSSGEFVVRETRLKAVRTPWPKFFGNREEMEITEGLRFQFNTRVVVC